MLSKKEIKQRYFDKKYTEAPIIECACGCGVQLKSVDKYARPVSFINGHNNREYYGNDATNWAREKRWRIKNPDKIREAKKKLHRNRKIKLISMLHGECNHCKIKYDGTNAPIFHFHHIKTKSFTIGNKLISKSWKDILKEINKCILLCANCHLKHHGGTW